MAFSEPFATDRPMATAERLLCVVALIAALGAAVNAYSYSLTAAIPLVQSDVWYFLDGFLGRFLEYGFQFGDLFRQANAADTNLPLQKLFLFFHTRYFGMDFTLEGALATAAAIASVLYFTAFAARRPISRWGAAEYVLLGALALVYLSLNSTNIYTWPLAGMWFLPLLIAAIYLGYVSRRSPPAVGIVVASALLGLALDELAYPVFVAGCLAALGVGRRPGLRDASRLVGAGAAGVAIARLVYWWFNRDVTALEESTRSWAPFFTVDVWKAISIPLIESVVDRENVAHVFGPAAAWAPTAIWTVLLLAHVGFWWTVLRTPAEASVDHRLARFAASIMLLFYGLVAGIVMQRVPTFGFEYLHQPRYVLFYQINLVALALGAYVRFGGRRVGPGVRIAAGATLVLLVVLQWQLSVLAWKHVKYLSVYVEGVARSMGTLQADPASTMECADIMTVCNFAPAKRAELLDRLMRYRMNVFSTDFQHFHRLYPYPPAPAPQAQTPTAGPAVQATAPASAPRS